MSKQSNQRYTKEKEKEHLKKAGIDNSLSEDEKNKLNKDKINHEFNSTSEGLDK